MKLSRAPRAVLGLILLISDVLSGASRSHAAPADGVPSTEEMTQIRREVEILRGKTFREEVPARTISEAELRALVDREVVKQYPGRKLGDITELMAWLDIVPSETDLKSVFEDLLVAEVAGLYDTETKTMCIPSYPITNHSAAKSPQAAPRRKVGEMPEMDPFIVFAHEYTHALEDQYWPMDDPRDRELEASSDRDDARSFLFEGSATRLMIEAMPAESNRRRPGTYVALWNLLHSGAGETVLDFLLDRMWKSSDATVAGVPEILARGEVMPYCYGYYFCRRIQRDWGLDGLDYIYDHPPVSTTQVMHPEKCWEQRHLPVHVSLPEALPGGWKRRVDDTIGEAGVAVQLGCQLKNLNRGERLALGWDGDRVALYEASDGHKLLAWASTWDSPAAADRFARGVAAAQKIARRALLTHPPGGAIAWTRPDGRAGQVWRQACRVFVFTTDAPESLSRHDAWASAIVFTEAPENAHREAGNHWTPWLNPLFSKQKNGDYIVAKSLAGLLWRHDHNRVGTADRALLGLLGERRRTTSLNQWGLAWGLAVRHQAEARRQFAKTTWLPWGLLYSHFSAALPQSRMDSLSRTSVVWGLVGTEKSLEEGGHCLAILPGGLLLRRTASPESQAFHLVGTGFSRNVSPEAGTTILVRVLGIPVWSSSTAR